MATRLFFALGAMLLVLPAPSSAQFWRQQNGYTYQYVNPQQQGYPNYQRPGYPQKQGYPQNNNQWSVPGVSVTEAEWVCKNPKTGDMMIITSEDVPTQPGNNGQGQWQQPNYPRPPVNNQPTYPQNQPTFPQTQPPNNQPTYPQVNPNYPTTQGPSYPNYPPTQKPQQPNQGTPNTNGEGVIDIRFGENKK